MKIAVPKATLEGERRVSLVPETCTRLKKLGLDVLIEAGAGYSAGFPDDEYEAVGARVVGSAEALFGETDLLVQVHPPTETDLSRIKPGTTLFAILNPLTRHDLVRRLAQQNVTSLAMDMMPRISRAQKMDVLSSQSTVAGYKAVLLAAVEIGKMFPLLMTAAGTITPAKVLILGAGVAGLQAIATARRLGAVVEAFDVRPVVKEQVQSLGAKFVEVEAPAEDAEDKGGYAKEMSDAYKQRQKEAIARHVKEADVAISTALIPGKPAPVLITTEMVSAMRPGSVVIDLAAEAGGNCELTRPDERVEHRGVLILGPRNLPATIPYHASQMYSRNIASFLQDLVKAGELKLSMEDECVAGTLITQNGQIVHPRIKELIGA